MEPRRALNLLDLVVAHADLEGRTESPHPGLWFWRRDRPSPPIASQTYSPVLAVIVQGRKVAHFAGRAYAYDPLHYIVFTGESEFASQILEASPDRPYLSVGLAMPPELVTRTLLALADHGSPAGGEPDTDEPAFVAPLAHDLHDALCRLIRASDDPVERTLIAPLVIEEIVVRLLRSDAAAPPHAIWQGPDGPRDVTQSWEFGSATGEPGAWTPSPEFLAALLAPADDPERAAHALAQHVRDLLAQPLALPGQEFFLDVSMGVSLHPAHGRGAEALLVELGRAQAAVAGDDQDGVAGLAARPGAADQEGGAVAAEDGARAGDVGEHRRRLDVVEAEAARLAHELEHPDHVDAPRLAALLELPVDDVPHAQIRGQLLWGRMLLPEGEHRAQGHHHQARLTRQFGDHCTGEALAQERQGVGQATHHERQHGHRARPEAGFVGGGGRGGRYGGRFLPPSRCAPRGHQQRRRHRAAPGARRRG